MRIILDEEVLDGPHEVRVTYRPMRLVYPVRDSSQDDFLSHVRYQCQIWAGANSPIVVVDDMGNMPSAYKRILAGSRIDDVHGLESYGLFNLEEVSIDLSRKRNAFGLQLAAAMYKYKQQDLNAPVEVVELSDDDTWKGIYAATLGLLPEVPDKALLKEGRLIPELKFEDFFHITREQVSGSLEDLIDRLDAPRAYTPRQASMFSLAHGNLGSTGIRTDDPTIPQQKFAQYDAGPNVVVVCSPDDVRDIALIWNLRCAHGDHTTLPIGIPLAELSTDKILKLAQHPRIARNGIPARAVYVTSVSVPVCELTALLDQAGNERLFGIADFEELLTFGAAAGWVRQEVLSWRQGSARFVPFLPERNTVSIDRRSLSQTTIMYCDVEVLDSPFPTGEDIRIDAPNSQFFAGVRSGHQGVGTRSQAREITWPSRLLIAQSIANIRGFQLQESEPGMAARVALLGMRDVSDVGMLIHAPLLSLLEAMSASQGISWFKAQLRQPNAQSFSQEAVGRTTDELSERSFGQFKQVFRNSDKATRFWLLWAEKAQLIVKGFPLRCSSCRAKQWIPVAAFSPPIVCRGCAEELSTPFGDSHTVNFRYRLSERLRRLYQHDAMGHLLVARYFDSIFRGVKSSELVGMHPGMELRENDTRAIVGEIDILLLNRSGEFIATEVKRTAASLGTDELEKLTRLSTLLKSPYSVVAACQYGANIDGDLDRLSSRRGYGKSRLVLTYDELLAPAPIWAISDDPFHWESMELEEIDARESEFVKRLEKRADGSFSDWLADSMLNPPELLRDRDG